MKKTTRARTLSAEAIASAQTTDHGVMRVALDDELARVTGGLPGSGGRLCGGTNTCLALIPNEPSES
jgi:hypothetical protein